MDEPPDLDVVDPDPAFGQLGDQAAQGEVAFRPLEQPVAMPAEDRPPPSADLVRSGAASAAMPLRPAHHARRADAQRRRHRTDALARQRELLEEFRQTETGDESPASQGFFAKLKTVWEELTD